MKVLVLDDDSVTRRSLARLLRSEGYEVDATHPMSTDELRLGYGAVVSDLEMGAIDGDQVCEYFARRGYPVGERFLLHSGAAHGPDVARALGIRAVAKGDTEGILAFLAALE